MFLFLFLVMWMNDSSDDALFFSLSLSNHRILQERREDQNIENPDMSDVMDGIALKARDHSRLPVQVGTHLPILSYQH